MSVDKQLVVEPASGRALLGRLRAPGDKSISHRALLIAARAEGRSRIRGLSNGQDVRHTLEAVVALGAGAEGRVGVGDGERRSGVQDHCVVRGVGPASVSAMIDGLIAGCVVGRVVGCVVVSSSSFFGLSLVLGTSIGSPAAFCAISTRFVLSNTASIR